MLKHQYRGDGGHRVVKLDIAGFLRVAGGWVGYQNIATLTVNADGRGVKTYIAVTDYFSGGELKADLIYEVSEVPTRLYAGSETVPEGSWR
jgi:hypothetical protein